MTHGVFAQMAITAIILYCVCKKRVARKRERVRTFGKNIIISHVSLPRRRTSMRNENFNSNRKYTHTQRNFVRTNCIFKNAYKTSNKFFMKGLSQIKFTCRKDQTSNLINTFMYIFM